MFRKKRERIFTVTVHCDGRHPYLSDTKFDMETQDVVLSVPAYDWNDAEKQALTVVTATVKAWSWYVTKIEDHKAEAKALYADRETE